ncbi:MAG: alpha/beta hydrolase [Planctomycetaceae bacterium]
MIRTAWQILLIGAVAAECCCICTAGGPIPTVRRAADPLSQTCLMPFAGDFRVPEDAGLPAETVHFENELGIKLRGWYLPAEGSQQTVVFCMGNTGNISIMLPYARILHGGGFDVLLFDYQGYGESEGQASVFSLQGDVRSAFDFVSAKTGRSSDQIGMFGVSLGSVLAMSVAAEKQAAAIAVEDVFIPSEMLDTMLEQDQATNAATKTMLRAMSGLLLSGVNPLVTVKGLKGPLFLIHGVHDRLLPPSATLRVAEASTQPTRVWMMQDTGHAPESLEVNEIEYAAQLQKFFREAFRGDVKDPALSYETKPEGNEFIVRATLEPPAGSDTGRSLQLAVCDRDGRFQFHRCTCRETETFAWKVPFQPTDVTVVEFCECDPASGDAWQPRLSGYSKALADYRSLAVDVFGSEEEAERLVQWQGNSFVWRPGEYPSRAAATVRSKLPAASDVPARIRPRYARLLARLQCWPGSEPAESDQDLSFAEAMLAYCPPDPDDYYELGNARIDLGFRDVAVARALYRLAEQRLANGRVEEGRDLLRRYLQVLPEWNRTTLNEERISKISTVADLKARPRRLRGLQQSQQREAAR